MIRIIPPKLYPYQEAIGNSQKKFTATEASTKIGKTYYHIWWQNMQTLGCNQYGKKYKSVKEGDNHWWIAPSINQAKIAFNRMRRRIIDVNGYYTNKSNRIIYTPLGTEWHFKTGDDPDALYGENVYSVVVDEATRLKKEAWDAIYSTTTVTEAEVKLIGNLVSTCFWFQSIKKKAIKGDPDWQYFNINCYDALEVGQMTQSQIDTAKRTLDDKTFSELYLCIEVEGESQVAKNNKIEQMFTNIVPSGLKCMTADIAFEGADLFVIGIWDGWNLTHVYSFEKSDPQQVVKIIQEYALLHDIHPSNICYDGDGIGMYLSGYLRTSISYKAGGAVQAEPEQYGMEKLNYANIDSQVLYNTAIKINNNQIGCSAELEGEVIERIKYEIKYIQTTTNGRNNKITCLSSSEIKKTYRKSPDYLVMLKLRYVFELEGTASDDGWI